MRTMTTTHHMRRIFGNARVVENIQISEIISSSDLHSSEFLDQNHGIQLTYWEKHQGHWYPFHQSIAAKFPSPTNQTEYMVGGSLHPYSYREAEDTSIRFPINVRRIPSNRRVLPSSFSIPVSVRNEIINYSHSQQFISPTSWLQETPITTPVWEVTLRGKVFHRKIPRWVKYDECPRSLFIGEIEAPGRS